MSALLRRLLGLWTRVELRPEEAVARIGAEGAPVCYVLERRSLTDLAVLENLCARHGLPRPGERLPVPGGSIRSALPNTQFSESSRRSQEPSFWGARPQ